MAKDFSGKNLQNDSFKGQDLVGANFTKAELEGEDFSYADLRSANFTNAKLYKANFRGAKLAGATLINADFREACIYGADFTEANLTGADFSYTKAGLQRRWVIFLIAASGIITVFSGFSLYTAKEYSLLLNITLLALVVIFLVLIKWESPNSKFKEIITIVILAVVYIGFFALLGVTYIATTLLFGCIFITIFTLAVGFEVGTSVMVISVALTCSAGMGILAVTGVKTDAIGLALGEMLFSIITSWRILARDKRFTNFDFISPVAISLATRLGTNFQEANLTNAKFSGAVLSSTNFRNTKLIRTCWLRSKKLDWSFVRGSILSNSTVRNLVVKEKGKSFVGLNLKGAYLAEMDLKKADFTEANLSEANLREAKLEEAVFVRANLQGAKLKGAHLKYANFREANIREANLQEVDLEWANLNKALAEGTNFTKAKLSASCLGEVWITDSKTKLEQVDCKFFYILEDPKPGTDDRERQPSIDEYAKGEFEKLHRKIQNTVQILLRNGTSQEALTVAFQKVSEKDPGIRFDTIRPIDQAWRHILLTMEVTKGTDKKEVERMFSYFHELEQKYQRSIGYREVTEPYLKDKHPTLHIENYQHQGHIMAENSGININAGGNVGAVGGRDVINQGVMNLDIINSNVTNAINQLADSHQNAQPEVIKLLNQLQAAINSENALKEEDKIEALEQVKVLAEMGKNPPEGRIQKMGKTALNILKGIVAGLPSAVKVVEACNTIAKLLGIG